MARELRGGLEAQGIRLGIIVSQFNDFVTSRLLQGAKEALSHHGIAEESVTIAWVPGALELPQMAGRMAASGSWDALVALGCVIRGETSHYDVVAAESARGIADVARQSGLPIAFGVLTTNDTEQAMARSGGAKGNKGFEAVETAIKMVNVYRQMDEANTPAKAQVNG
ncbi:MAG: 6,7-dimethyl-8-ribityllumazine synthase [Dehalococcoidia bacterium]